MSDILDRLKAYIRSDHARGCDGRCYACSCDYDAEGEDLHGLAFAEIERLRSAPSAPAPSQGAGIGRADLIRAMGCVRPNMVTVDGRTTCGLGMNGLDEAADRILSLLEPRPQAKAPPSEPDEA